MKTMKSMLIKLLSVICAFSCCFALCFGLVACGEEEVVIVGSSINDAGKLVLTYSDGSSKEYDVIGKDGVDGEDGEDGKDLTACAHTNSIVDDYKISIKNDLGQDWYADYCTMQQAICVDCGHVYVKLNGHDLEEVPAKPATCYEDGYTAGLKCKDCDYLAGESEVISKDTVAHTEKTYFIAYDEADKSPCTHGGFLITVCEVCREEGYNAILDRVDVAGLGHKASNWELVTPPTTDSEGLIKAPVCADCGFANVTKVLPKLTDANYTVELTKEKASCTDYETNTYTIYLNNGQVLSKVGAEGEQSFSFEVDGPVGNHKLANGETFEEGKVYNYDAELFTKFGNATETCADAGFEVFFECEDCGEYIQTKAKIAHKTVFEVADNPATDEVEKPTVDVAPECESTGLYEAYVCPVCNQTIDDAEALLIPALDHEFLSYTIAETYADGKVKLVSNCTRYNDCGKQDIIDNAVAEYVKVEATCEKEGSETWTVTEVNGVALEEPLVATNVLPKVPHKLGEEEIDLDEVYDWTIYEAKGMKGFANEEYNCSSEGFNVFFTCSSCEQPITVKAIVPHTRPADPTPDDNNNELIVVTAPTCGVKGTEVYTCTVCNQQQTEYIDELVHSVVYSMTVDNKGTDDIADDIATIKATCVHGEKHTDALTRVEVVFEDLLTKLVKTVKVEATCLVDGIDTYTWTNGTESLSADVNIGKALHKLNGEYIDDTVTHYIGNGIVAMGNSTPACDSLVPGQGMFTCEHCKQPISVPVKEAHTKPATGVVVNDATCLGGGTVEYTCTKCNKPVTEDIAQKQHVVTYQVETLVKPTATVAGEIYVKCATCDTKTVRVEIPALSEAKAKDAADATNYTFVINSQASCQSAGVTTYTYDDATYGVISFTIDVPKTEHDINDVPEYTWTYNGKLYTGKVCKLGEADEKHIVILSVVDAPAA